MNLHQNKTAILKWCQRCTEGYKGVKIDNFTTSWTDGLAFCALIDNYRPSLINFTSLTNANQENNLTLAFDVAEKQLGVMMYIDAEDLIKYRPDSKVLLLQLSEFYLTLSKLKPERNHETKTKTKTNTTTKKTDSTKSTFPSSKTNKNPNNRHTHQRFKSTPFVRSTKSTRSIPQNKQEDQKKNEGKPKNSMQQKGFGANENNSNKKAVEIKTKTKKIPIQQQKKDNSDKTRNNNLQNVQKSKPMTTNIKSFDHNTPTNNKLDKKKNEKTKTQSQPIQSRRVLKVKRLNKPKAKAKSKPKPRQQAKKDNSDKATNNDPQNIPKQKKEILIRRKTINFKPNYLKTKNEKNENQQVNLKDLPPINIKRRRRKNVTKAPVHLTRLKKKKNKKQLTIVESRRQKKRREMVRMWREKEERIRLEELEKLQKEPNEKLENK
ncbi:mical-like 1a-related [Anaeramoeba flamelloides]|uniref:Mical-like 1a-related n=1 Tax=Anaeramoeba flamelloides TaxID=1746091 RepID=A0AAV8ABJ5_9EUKA|nr:mical-like 1a-related [Anaeramoeba flamelloides]